MTRKFRHPYFVVELRLVESRLDDLWNLIFRVGTRNGIYDERYLSLHIHKLVQKYEIRWRKSRKEQ